MKLKIKQNNYLTLVLKIIKYIIIYILLSILLIIVFFLLEYLINYLILDFLFNCNLGKFKFPTDIPNKVSDLWSWIVTGPGAPSTPRERERERARLAAQFGAGAGAGNNPQRPWYNSDFVLSFLDAYAKTFMFWVLNRFILLIYRIAIGKTNNTSEGEEQEEQEEQDKQENTNEFQQSNEQSQEEDEAQENDKGENQSE